VASRPRYDPDLKFYRHVRAAAHAAAICEADRILTAARKESASGSIIAGGASAHGVAAAALASDEWGPWAWPMPRYGAVCTWLQEEYGLTAISLLRHGRGQVQWKPLAASVAEKGSRGSNDERMRDASARSLRLVAKRRAVAAVRALFREGGIEVPISPD